MGHVKCRCQQICFGLLKHRIIQEPNWITNSDIAWHCQICSGIVHYSQVLPGVVKQIQVLSNIVRYCRVFLNNFMYCQVLSNIFRYGKVIFRYCQALSNIFRYCQPLHCEEECESRVSWDRSGWESAVLLVQLKSPPCQDLALAWSRRLDISRDVMKSEFENSCSRRTATS